jgi:hypothetical protein
LYPPFSKLPDIFIAARQVFLPVYHMAAAVTRSSLNLPAGLNRRHIVLALK